MWTYEQASGELFDAAGELVATGYSGFPPSGRNNPALQDEPNVGPIPCGLYTIGAPIDLEGGPHGPYVLPLTPDPANAMHGRAGFLIHGDGLGDHAGSASHGCVILSRAVRTAIAASGDNRLKVEEGSAL
jgi:hypothetical protein